MAKRLLLLIFGLGVLVSAILLTHSQGANAQADLGRVGLVVQFMDGAIEQHCIQIAKEPFKSYDVLKDSGLSIIADFSPTMGAAICRINQDGCSADNCFCDVNNYWSYWHLGKDSDGRAVWIYSSRGSSNYAVQPGDVEGWRFGAGEAPAEIPTFDEICPAPTPTHTATSTYTATPPFTATPWPTVTPWLTAVFSSVASPTPLPQAPPTSVSPPQPAPTQPPTALPPTLTAPPARATSAPPTPPPPSAAGAAPGSTQLTPPPTTPPSPGLQRPQDAAAQAAAAPPPPTRPAGRKPTNAVKAATNTAPTPTPAYKKPQSGKKPTSAPAEIALAPQGQATAVMARGPAGELERDAYGSANRRGLPNWMPGFDGTTGFGGFLIFFFLLVAGLVVVSVKKRR